MRRRLAAQMSTLAIALIAALTVQGSLATRAAAAAAAVGGAPRVAAAEAPVALPSAAAVGVKLVRLPQPAVWAGIRTATAEPIAADVRVARPHLAHRPRSQAQHFRLHPPEDEPPQRASATAR